MTAHLLKRSRRVVDHWLTQLLIGTILLLSVFTEIVALHHGVGIWYLATTTPNLLQGLERVLRRVQKEVK